MAIGAFGSVVAAVVLEARPPGGLERWTRKNHAGRPVTLLEGPAYAVAAVAGALVGGAGAPAAVACLGGAAVGALDDLAGDGSSKGLGGHLRAALRGEVTTGAIKVAGLGATGVLSAAMIDRSRQQHLMATLVGGALIAGLANMVNLFDLRPGRALKVVLLLAAPIAVCGRRSHPGPAAATASAVVGAGIGALPDDLAGRSMLGDTGANSAGALLGAALVGCTGLRGRLFSLAVVTALTLVSEKVSFTKVIESTPGLRQFDALGRPGWSSLATAAKAMP
jgi:UDP-N-acetylmuramyl pentapeptide phosphotransferase/UDP-N-acetylglucosamine-1-phosphate transferase